jgi:hypothetical protein
MRLYPLTDAGAVDDPQHGRFEVQDHGGFDFPDELSTRLHGSRPGGRRHWETEIERDERRHGEESARRRDPESLYSAVDEIAGMFRRMAALQLPGEGKETDALNAKIEDLEARLAAAEKPAGQPAPAAPAPAAPVPAAKPAAKAAAAK